MSEIKNERFYKSNLFLQLKKFQILEYVAFKYDFNHDGNDEILSFTHDSVTGYIHFEIGGGNEADLSYLRSSYGLNKEKSLRIPA